MEHKEDATVQAAKLGRLWISTSEFAGLAVIHNSNARDACKKCHDGGTWRGHTLEVRKVNGKAYQINPHTLPADLFNAWSAKQQNFLPVVVDNTLPAAHIDSTEGQSVTLPADTPEKYPNIANMAKRMALGRWKMDLISPALAYEKRSRARGSVVKDIAAREHIDPNGKRIYIPERTLSSWIESYEKKGLRGLVRRERHEKGPRVFITEKWDAACPLADDKKTEIAAALTMHIRSLWRHNTSWPPVADLAASFLLEQCRAAGWSNANLTNCYPGRYAVEREIAYRVLCIEERDAKKFHDEYVPRIRRNHALHAPFDVVFGDVHPIDIYFKRADGSLATPRLIAWYDLATHYRHYTLVLLNKGEGIRREHIWASFALLAEKICLPIHQYRDNGPEYQGPSADEGFQTLSGLVVAMRDFVDELLREEGDARDTLQHSAVREHRANIRSRPYNAPAKPNEGDFSKLEKRLALLPGSIGGNRMTKKTQNVGKAPEPFPGTWEEFHAAFDDVAKWINATPEPGSRDGKSAYQRLQDHIDAGWSPFRAKRETLILAFSEERRVKVNVHGVTVDDVEYEHSELFARYRQQYIIVRFAKWAPERLLYVRPDSEISANQPERYVWILRKPEFNATDGEGAKEQARGKKALTNHINGLKRETYRLDITEEIARHVAHLPGMPDMPEGATIDMVPDTQDLIDASEKAGKPGPQKAIPLRHGDVIDKTTGKISNLIDGLANHAPPASVSKPENLLDRLAANQPAKPVPAAHTNPLDELVRRYAGQK